MSRDSDRHYHHEKFTARKFQESKDAQQTLKDRFRVNSAGAEPERDASQTPPTSLLRHDRDPKRKSFQMEVAAGDLRATISKCRNLSSELKDYLTERQDKIELTSPDAETTLRALANEVAERAKEKYDFYFRRGKAGQATAVMSDLSSIEMSIWELADKVSDYQIHSREK